MSGIQRYGALSEYGGHGDGDAKLFKKYAPNISWGERVFYRRSSTATKVYEITHFPQELKEYDAVNGKVETDDITKYVDINEGFLIFNNSVYRFGFYDQTQPKPYPFITTDEIHMHIEEDVDKLMGKLNVFNAQTSAIWYWDGDKYVYTLDFDCINTTPITTSIDEPISGALAKTQSVVLKTQYFNDVDEKYIPNRFDIVEWKGDLYIVDEQDTIPTYRPALVNYYLISMTKLL